MNPIKIFCWNCRGPVSNPSTLNRVKTFISYSSHLIICLFETKSDTDRIHRFCHRFAINWEWAAIPTLGLSGGIIILWNRNIGNVTLVVATRMSLNLVISQGGVSYILSVIYNSQVLFAQRVLWRH